MADIKFEVKRELGVLSEGSKGWKKEINLISWNERKPKIDIRDWDGEHVKMGKGITMNQEELLKLKEILNSIDLEEIEME